MSEQKKARRKTPVLPPGPKTVTQTIAERYLDLWLDNIKYWTTTPPVPPEDKE